MQSTLLAVGVAIVGIALEVFIATLDFWFHIPHIILHIGG